MKKRFSVAVTTLSHLRQEVFKSRLNPREGGWATFFENDIFSMYDDLHVFLARSLDQLIKVLGRFSAVRKTLRYNVVFLYCYFGLSPLVSKIISVLFLGNSQ
jgi:hypothetical protein